MESQMESIDISSIKAAALRPPQQRDLDDHSGNDGLRAIQEAFQKSITATKSDKSPRTHHHNGNSPQTAQFLNVSDSLPYLPSTVPDSQIAANVESILQEIPDASMPDLLRILKKMSSQGGVPQDTQPLSPAFIESIVSKAKTLQDNDTRHDYGNETAATNHTLHEGDEGHVDLLSSYKPEENLLDDELDSESVDFSPTQSHLFHLSQFPESQRFKTPATVGKKRNYTGGVVESPVLPRNPLARNGEPTPGRMMGLSQAFAATQAGSSPFHNVLPSDLRSDRPSPNMTMQARPGSTAELSPLQTRIVLPGSSTEPQTKYISVKESQARRAARRRIEQDGNGDEDSDNSFDETPTELRRLRKKSKRDAEAARQFQAMAAARSPTGPWSSPVRKARKHNISSSVSSKVVHNKIMSDLSVELEVLQEQHEGTNPSEEETEEEDDSEVAVRRSSQIPRMEGHEEDKENAMIGAMQIPETAALHRVMNGFAAEVEASPSVRPNSENVRLHPTQIAEDVEPFAVADSQPSQSWRHQALNGANRKLRSSGEQTDFVPQSQLTIHGTCEPYTRHETRGNEQTAGQVDDKPRKQQSPISIRSGPDARCTVAEISEEIRPPSLLPDEDEEDPPWRTLRSQAAPQSNIPETSSRKPNEGCSHRAQSFLQSSLDRSTTTAIPTKSLSEFDTAPTHPQPSANNSVPAPLSLTTPGLSNHIRTKRRRMDEIDAELSQRSSGPSFDGIIPDLDDTEFSEIMGSSSPIRPGRLAKRRRLYGSPLKPSRSQHHDLFLAPSNDEERQADIHETEGGPALDPLVLDGGPSPLELRSGSSVRSRAIARLSVPGGEPAKTTYGSSRSKLSAWDIDLSPPQTMMPKRAENRRSLRRPPSTRPSGTADLPFTSPRIHRSRAAQVLPGDGTDTLSMSTAKPIAESRGPPDGRVIAPNQVFACFNGKVRAYYPAKCLGVCGVATTRYQVQWEGYDSDELDAHGVCSLDLRSGDSVKVNLEGFPKTAHIIRGFKNKAEGVCGAEGESMTDIRGYKTLLVVAKQRKSLPIGAGPDDLKEVPVSAIYLDSNMWGQMKDRTFEFVASAPTQAFSRPGFSTPMDRPSTPSTPGSRSRRLALPNSMPNLAASTTVGLFSNMAFAISYDDPSRKSTLTQLITSNGALVLNAGFHELLTDDLGLKPQFASLGFAALLADKHSRKEKYMQALALGLPCLSGKWIETCIASSTLTAWQSYLLSAGESAELEGAVRSRVLPDIDVANTKTTTLMSTRPNILDGASVIFVLGRGKAEEKRRPYLFLTQALGAGKVVKVADISSADGQLQQDRGVEWVLVDDRDVTVAKALFAKRGRQGMDDSAKVRGNEFVKQSLILGRMYGS